jgi:2-oxoglutarate ferredoxin oxidoreductase subunit beta
MVAMDYLAQKYLRPRKIPSNACSGCGLGQVQKAIVKAIDELGLETADIVWGSGIGCAGRQTFATWKGDNFAGTHGRVYAIASGLRIALKPDKKIVLTVGDGDAFGIGLLNLLHCARRNANMMVVVCDNLGYMSTGGQYGWTTPLGVKTDSSPYGGYEYNFMQEGIDVLNLLKDAGATFLARHTSQQGPDIVESAKKALQNKGLSLIHVIYPCVTNFSDRALGTRNPKAMQTWIKEHTYRLHDQVPQGEISFRTGIYLDASNTRQEFADRLFEFTRNIQRRSL